MLKERGKWLQLRFNIPNILENKRNVEWMLKQSLKAFKLFQHRFNILSTRFNNVERGWQTLSTLPFNKIERMLKQMLKLFARALSVNSLILICINRKSPWSVFGAHVAHLLLSNTLSVLLSPFPHLSHGCSRKFVFCQLRHLRQIFKAYSTVRSAIVVLCWSEIVEAALW